MVPESCEDLSQSRDKLIIISRGVINIINVNFADEVEML